MSCNSFWDAEISFKLTSGALRQSIAARFIKQLWNSSHEFAKKKLSILLVTKQLMLGRAGGGGDI